MLRRVRRPVSAQVAVGVARHEEDHHFGMQWGQTVGQLRAAHLGHHHIGHHEVDGPRVLFTEQQSLASVPGLYDVVAVQAEKSAQQSPERLFIFHHQNGF